MLGFQALVVSALVSSSADDEVFAGVHAPHTVVGAGGARAWRDRYREDGLEKVRRAYLLALVRQSDDYKRLKRKLAMLREHLLDARGRVETVTVREKIADIEAQIEMMERLE
jgi:predicted nuclease of restriction endonuclease-like RecB superfamily